MLASKHLTPIIGIDVHIVIIPPGVPTPIPHPFIGLIMDPMDYVPFIGASVNVNGLPLGNGATTGMLGIFKHIPLGGPFAMMPLIGHESQNFFGSLTVKGDGSLFSVAPNQLMTCNDIGIPLGPSPELYAPTSSTIPIPPPMMVNVGGPQVPDLQSLATVFLMGGLMKIGGKLIKKAGKLAKKAITKLNHGVLKTNPNKFTNCLSEKLCKMGFEPVNLVNGAMVYEYEDFALPGGLPFTFTRKWYSDSEYKGPLGHGWHHNHDMAIREYPAQNGLEILLQDGRTAETEMLWNEGDQIYHRPEKLTIERKNGKYLLTLHEQQHYILFAETEKGIYRPLEMYNNAGKSIKYAYKGKTLHEITDSAGRKITFHYTGRHISSIHASHRGQSQCMASFSYDKHGNMLSVADANNAETLMEYLGNKMVKKTDRDGNSFYWQYDKKGRVEKTWGDNGLMSGTIEYFPKKGYNLVTNSLGNTSTIYYHPSQLVYKETNPLGHSRYTEYTPSGEVYRLIDEEGNATGYTYDELGFLENAVMPDLTEETYIYNPEGQIQMYIDADNNKRQWVYNEKRLLKSILEPDKAATYFDYDQHNQLVAIRDKSGAKTQLQYDTDGNLEIMEAPNGAKTEWGYDAFGNCLHTRMPGNMLESYTFDKLGRLVQIRKSDGNVLDLTYNAYEEVIAARDNNHQVQFEYTPLGSLKKRVENGTQVRFFYDTEEQLQSITNEKNESYVFTRNLNGDIISEKAFDGITRNYLRDHAGKVLKVNRPGGRYTEYEYNQKGQITKALHSDGTWETYRYNKSGLLVEAKNQDNEVVFDRDLAGRIIKEQQGEHSVESHYNKLGQRTNLLTSLGANVAMAYDQNGQLASTRAKQGNDEWFSHLQYNMLGLEIERSLPGGIKSTMGYDRAGRPNQHKVTGAGNKIRMHKRYKWTANDRLQQVINEISGGETIFSHDAFGNLASCRYANGEYDYKLPDNTGNLYRDKEQKGRKYGAGGQLLQTTEHQYEYDAEGNLTRKTGNNYNKVFEWYGNGMLKLVRHDDGSETRFEYDALGRRTAKIHRGQITRFVWDGNVPIHEWTYSEKDRPLLQLTELGDLEYNHEEPVNKENLITWLFDEGTFRPSGKLIGDKKYSIICDYLGTPTQAYDETGELVWECELDIYGKVRSFTGESSLIPFRYQGQYEDIETGLYYNRFRYYAPEEGVYISQDPIGLDGGENFYSYVKDNNFWVDMFGLGDCQGRDKFGKFLKKNADESMPGKDFEKIVENKLRKNKNIEVLGTNVTVKTEKGNRFIDILFRNKKSNKLYAGEVKSNGAVRNASQKAKDKLIDSGEGVFGNGSELKGKTTKGVKSIVMKIFG